MLQVASAAIYAIITEKTGSIVVCISPLTSLMLDQRDKYSPRGLAAEFVGGEGNDLTVKARVLEGDVQLVFITPESAIQNKEYRSMFLSAPYQERLVALVVDEAHCIKTWGETFRKVFTQIGTLRSLIPNSVKVMALTATATTETFHIVSRKLSMVTPALISLPPHRENIAYKVLPKTDVYTFSNLMCEELALKRTSFPKTVIYVRKYSDCSKIYMTLKYRLGIAITEPPGYPNISQFRLVDMFTSVMTLDKKEEVLKSFSLPGNLRIVICTTAFGMGIDCPDIRRVIHWGIPTNLEEYAQETGRVGRDEQPSLAIIYRGIGGKNATINMKTYMDNNSKCRRIVLFQNFLSFKEKVVTVCGLHRCCCCDVCGRLCVCGLCKQN